MLVYPLTPTNLDVAPVQPNNLLAQLPSVNDTPSWRELNDRYEDEQPRGGGRGDLVCIISPRTGSDVMWSDRPLFVWHNSIQSLTLNLPDGPPWQPEITPETHRVLYPQALPPGDYIYEITYIKDGQLERQEFEFGVMSASDRAPHQAALDAIEAQSRLDRSSEDEVARRRAAYFLEQGWNSDYIQEIYMAPNSSRERIREAEAIGNWVCPPS